MTKVTFKVYCGRKSVSFACPTCGKRRTRTFTVEHTVNPYNRDEQGYAKKPDRVQREAREAAALEANVFMTKPLCASCENGLSWTARDDLSNARKAAFESAVTSRPTP